MTFLSPFITEPLGYDRVLDVTLEMVRKIKVVQFILHQIVSEINLQNHLHTY